MTDDEAPTLIETKAGEILPFQDYLVKEKAQPEVEKILLHGGAEPNVLPDALEAIYSADLVILAPSNPWVSIDPILALTGVLEALSEKTVIAVSPIIQGKALKGPAAKMFSELNIEPSSRAVMEHYADFLDVFVYDESDLAFERNEIPEGIDTVQMQTIMMDENDKIALAEAIINYALSMKRGR